MRGLVSPVWPGALSLGASVIVPARGRPSAVTGRASGSFRRHSSGCIGGGLAWRVQCRHRTHVSRSSVVADRYPHPVSVRISPGDWQTARLQRALDATNDAILDIHHELGVSCGQCVARAVGRSSIEVTVDSHRRSGRVPVPRASIRYLVTAPCSVTTRFRTTRADCACGRS